MRGDAVCLLILMQHTVTHWVMQLEHCCRVARLDWSHLWVPECLCLILLVLVLFHAMNICSNADNLASLQAVKFFYPYWCTQGFSTTVATKPFLRNFLVIAGGELGCSCRWMDCWRNCINCINGCREKTWYASLDCSMVFCHEHYLGKPDFMILTYHFPLLGKFKPVIKKAMVELDGEEFIFLILRIFSDPLF